MKAVKKETFGWGFEDANGKLVTSEVYSTKVNAHQFIADYKGAYKVTKVKVQKYIKK